MNSLCIPDRHGDICIESKNTTFNLDFDSAKYMYRIENTPFNLDLTVHRVKFNNVGVRTTALRKKVQFS